MRKKLIILSLLMCPTLLSMGACSSPTEFTDGFKNMFIPKADVFVTSIQSIDPLKGVSIIQTFKAAPTIASGNFAEYKYNDPTVTIANRPGLPRVIFKQMIVEYSLDSKSLPAKRLPVTFTVPVGGQFSATIPILSSSDDLINAVFPNNSPANIRSALAQVTLLGVDDNNNLSSLNFNVPVRFESDLSGIVAPSATPSPSVSPIPSGT